MSKKPKVKPRRHGRKALAQNDDKGVLARRDEAVAKFDRAFRSSLPQHEASGQNAMSSGHYAQVEGDQWDGQEYPVADGKYRVQGSDWLLTFQGGGFVEAELAQPPAYGGKDVISVLPLAPGK